MVPEIDDLTGGVLGTRSALEELFTSCARNTRCRQAYPHLEDSWANALARLARSPLRGKRDAGTNGDVNVTVDPGKLLRAARFTLGGDGPSNLDQLPSIIKQAERGVLHPKLAEIIATDPGLCFGYRPLCTRQEGFSLGVYLTTFCRNQLPFLDKQSLERSIA